MKYYAHSKPNQPEHTWHLLREHLIHTAQKAQISADKFDAASLGYVIGLLHDIGKYSDEFQRRIRGEKIKVDHSTAGAVESCELYGDALGTLMAFPISGHHGGLPDYGSEGDHASLKGRLERAYIPDYTSYSNEITLQKRQNVTLPIKPLQGLMGFSLSFFIRMLFSCLVDADFLDTEAALDHERSEDRGGYASLKELLDRLEDHLTRLQKRSQDTELNRHRSRILDECRKAAMYPPGLFSLTVPTGGGKTLSSLDFALRHAIKHGMDRVIYVIPYTSIIEQNAGVFKDILGVENVLEHHSNFQYPYDNEENNSIYRKIRLSAENWDIPVVVTTSVQFFESLFSSRGSKCRKLHNIAKSVVILDEAQMLPTDYLKPCLAAIAELVQNYKTSLVFCTATQPAIGELLPGEMKPREIISQPKELYKALKRVRVTNLGERTNEQLAEELAKLSQVLCIVNTRGHAREIYEAVKRESDTYHLSARMCPVHRKERLAFIKDKLEGNQPCRLISTQLIEAGVDIDFPVVFRAAAGIDSIAQAAGRCNREGREKEGHVYVFWPEKQGLPSGWFSRTAAVAGMVLRKFPDALSLEAVQAYFELLYDFEDKHLDKKEILQTLERERNTISFSFEKIDRDFQFIEGGMKSIIIPWDGKCQEYMEQLEWIEQPGIFSRLFQPYVVQVHTSEFLDYQKAGILYTINDTYHFLADSSYYDDDVGLLPCQVSYDDILMC